MRQPSEEVSEGSVVGLVVDDEPVDLDAEERTAPTEECRYCGHLPCGCGG